MAWKEEALTDLMRQGFMRGVKAKKPPKEPPPIIACDDCLNWHRKGQHTADKATRAQNRRAKP